MTVDRRRATAMFLYGAAVVASGTWRFTMMEGGKTGFVFGLVMGAIAFVSGVLLRRGTTRIGLALGVLALAVVGGWFYYESFVKKGFAEAEVRQLVIIAITLVTALVLARRS